jgi:hypothetical protein
MAQKVSVKVTCDMHDGEEVPAAESMSFTLDGKPMEIDVCGSHAAQLRELMTGYAGHARRSAAGKTRPPARRQRDRRASASKRAWASEQGFEVSPRGRIPGEVEEAYAHRQRRS